MDNIQPFKLSVPNAVLQDLQDRLSRARFPDQLMSPANSEWLYGSECVRVKEVVRYWKEEFDWPRAQRAFNSMGQQFLGTLPDGRKLHFLHKVSKNAQAKPLLIAHGWPGSIYEFHKLIPLLTESFHIICPSIPGYGFSDPFRGRGGNTARVAADFDCLMTSLGYESYFTQGGDWGSLIIRDMARSFPNRVLAIHTCMPISAPPKDFDPKSLTPEEMEGMTRTVNFRNFETAYQKIQGQKPQTLAYGLNDSPTGLMAWILEKFHSWTDNNMEFVSLDEFLTNVMIYWVSQSIGSSIRFYFENGTGSPQMPGIQTPLNGRVTVPTAAAVFPADIYQLPLSWIRNSYNLHRYNSFKRGGHFSAMECPSILAEDIKDWFLVDYPKLPPRAKL